MKEEVYGPGDRGAAVAAAKTVLEVFPSTDLYDDRLMARVRGYQIRYGIEPSGLLDEQTIRALALKYPKTGNTGP